LVARLGYRGPLSPLELEQRLRRAVEELDEARYYDYLVVNEDRTQAVAEVAAIIDAESRRTGRQADVLKDIEGLRQGLLALLAHPIPQAEQGTG
jgi:guanylate kinase